MRVGSRVLPLLIAAILSGGLSRYAAAQPLVPQTNGGSFSTTLGPYEYDADGNIETIGGVTPMAFTYDGLGRLHTASVAVPGRTAITQTYDYDQFGNRKSATGAGSVCVGQLNCDQPATAFGIDVTTNHLTTGTGGAVAYNTRGGVTTFGTTLFTYTPDDAVATEERPTETRYYLYTASGERVAVYTVPKDARPKRWEWSLRDESGKVLSRYTSSDDPQASVPGTANLTLTEDLVYRDGLMFASKSGAAVNYFHLDHLGTPRLITSALGGKIGEHVYLPFGPELEWPGSIQESPEEAAKFTGHDRDSRPDAGMLDYMHARYYGGVVGRFLSVDPTRASMDYSRPQSLNRYAYVENRPVDDVDRDGRCPQCALAGVIVGTFFAGVRETRTALSEPVEWKSSARRVLGAAVAGGISGASGSVKGALAVRMFVAAVGSGAGGALGRAIAGGKQSLDQTQKDVAGGVIGFVGGEGVARIGKALGAAALSNAGVGDAAVRTEIQALNAGYLRTSDSQVVRQTTSMELRTTTLSTASGESIANLVPLPVPALVTAEEKKRQDPR